MLKVIPAEMKHDSIALIDDQMPVFLMIATKKDIMKKLSNIEGIKKS
jgi:glucosamine 6-phosphate synthetase-like amidotransferase/phosphosugar isomerase protein